jgi:hypothetical protein
MSYKIRKDLRICSDWILSILCGNPLEDVNPNRVDWLRYKFDTYNTRQLMALENYSLDELNASIRLLLRNKHIMASSILDDIPHKNIFATIDGQDAFDESFYLRENKRDRLESIELYTKWVLPIIGTVAALTALALSIFNLIRQNHTWK